MIRTEIVRRLLTGCVLACSLLLPARFAVAEGEYATDASVFVAESMDWPFWRGPEMNGISREKGIVTNWHQDGEAGSNLLWENKELAGKSTPIVMKGKLYMLARDQPETKREGEKVICADAATGNILWERRFNVFQSDVPDTRVGWSSVAGDPTTGDVFALGACGYFMCLDGESGAVKWSHSLSEEYGLLSTYGGRTNFPLVHGNLVIISAIIIGWGDMAKPAHRFIAFDKRNGQAVWFKGTRVLPFDTTYSSPVLTIIKGQAAMVFGSGDGGLHAFQPQTGKKIWSYEISDKRGINTTPLIVGNRVFSGHGQENPQVDPKVAKTMGALLSVDLNTGKKVWRQNGWEVGKSSALEVNGRIYAAEDGGKLKVVDAKTGKLISEFRLGGAMHGSPLYVDGKIFLGTTTGVWWVLEPTATGVKSLLKDLKDPKKSLRRGQRLGNSRGMYASPIVSHGRLYITTEGGMYCVGVKGKKPSTDKPPAPPKEADIDTDTKPTHLQVVPVEALLKPGQRQQYQARLYNSRGQYLGLADANDVKFGIKGVGKIDGDGKYFSPEATSKGGNKAAAIAVTATFKGLTGKARIRVIPDLAWNVDFNDGVIPVTWVGARYRHIPLDYNLYSELEKTDVKLARLYLFLQSGAVNGQRGKVLPTLTYKRTITAETLTDLLAYLGLKDDVTTPDQMKATLNPWLDILVKKEFIEKYTLVASKDPDPDSKKHDIELKITKGTRKIGDGGVMVKIITIPKGQRSQGWMGHTSFQNYTIQADVLGAERVSVVEQGGKEIRIVKTPDIGIAGQRYVLDLMGAKQQMQIRTWHPQLFRMSGEAPFAWKPNVWYTLKLSASNENGKAILRAKCWKRGTSEPKEWMLTAEDESPNLSGSPGLYGNAIDAEIFYDNIKVYKNKN